jgi:uncharacterized membrane protein
MYMYIISALVVIAGAAGFFFYRRSGHAAESKAHHQEARLKDLKMQYMKGEITKEEYDERRAGQKA